MFLDLLTQLSDAQAMTASAYSTNTIDQGDPTAHGAKGTAGTTAPYEDLGVGEPMALSITVDVAADTGNGDETYQFEFVQSANADLSSQDTLASLAIARATLVAKYKFAILIPQGQITKRYLGAHYTLGGTTPSITVTAELVPASFVQNNKAYAKGYVIS